MPRMACSETEAEVIKTNQAVFQDLEDCADCLFAVGSSLYRFEIYQTLGVYRFSVFWYFEASLQSFGGVEVTGYGNLSDC